ncbi:hypothetical protein MES4922_300003 [Mesorhizobium ventifaucium]|uniref:Uncharacterized protein n=1 Tax=Mesorhizobium ventifaucium TaxID=666020 RepID=A0ABN8JZT0_9HYPH|nr:hypothetical protein MES4922_300003 [Mesorhizobium ventifaucium]
MAEKPRGAIETMHGRRLEMFFLNRLKPEYSRDADGRMPSDKFVAECTRPVSGFPAKVNDAKV